ncbi:interleukin-27 subunit beta [Mugil cephalus]|uniref:interleukin-27 subunit beta n=1 Tax=Mugil cephalus TaxID=48193 RepID=UPI001FB81F20|nr:interleukin-27 subunit beta [Mugil cephalus]
MAALFGSVLLLVCVHESQALDLLSATATSGDAPPVPRVYCWCASYPNVTTCSWPEPSPSAPARYIATYRERNNQESTKECHLIPPGPSSSSYEQLWRCHLPNLKLLTDYIINVTAVHSSGSSSHLTSFMLEDIVKPDRPVDIRVSPHGPRKMLLEWSPPPTWTNMNILPLKYHIVYKWIHRGTPMLVNLGPFENTRMELRGLTLGRTYLFQVCAEELLGLGERSDWSLPVNFTVPRPNH